MLKPLIWALRWFLFFALFAFALNNQHEVTVRWFFGHEWRTTVVFVALAAFIAGLALGVLALTPTWWRRREQARLERAAPVSPSPELTPSPSDSLTLIDSTHGTTHGQ